MSQDALFGSPEPVALGPTAALAEPAVSDRQVTELRMRLDLTGVGDMGERQRLVESLIGRAVDSLRALTASEGRILASKLHELAPRSDVVSDAKSTWEARDEATWIDRL